MVQPDLELAAASVGLDPADLAYLSPDELATLRELVEGDKKLLHGLWGMEYDELPVDPETWLLDPYYMGATGANLYPRWREDFVEVCAGDYTDVILGGAIGTGKSTFTEFLLLRTVYEVLCLKNPQVSFGLMPGSSIVICNISVSEEQAKKAIFTHMLEKVRLSPWFKEKFPYDPRVKSELRFPKNVTVFPGASTNNSLLGLNVIAGALDEGNFMPVQQASQSRAVALRAKARGGTYDKAESLYNAMLRRMKSRFLRFGKLPGRLITLSSAQYPDDFISRRMRAALSDPSIFVRSYALWEVNREKYSPKTFRVEVGTDLQGSRILTGEEAPDSVVGDVIDVPVDFLRDFEKDIDDAIRDIAGVATLTVDQFIRNFSKVMACVKADRQPAYTADTTNLVDGHKLYRRAFLDVDEAGKKTLRYNPDAPRVAHIDPSLRRDATGLAVGHIADVVKVLRRNADGEEFEEWAPLIHYDLILRIVAPRFQEIEFERVRDILYALKEDGMSIELVTYDSWQSAEALQHLRKRGFLAEQLSVDKTIVPYETLKQAFYEERVSMYHHEPALFELRRLEFDRLRGKVDHPEKGQKDVSDAMAAVAYTLTEFAPKLYRPTLGVQVFG